VVCYVYDVTNSALITPLVTSIPAMKGTFSTAFDSVATSGSYRLILHVATTNATALTLKVDSFKLFSNIVGGSAVQTPWQTYSPSFNGITATGANTRVWWQQRGESIALRGNIKIATVSAGGLEMSLPNGWTVNTNKLNFLPNSTHFGYYQRLDSSNWNPITTGGAMGEIFYNGGSAVGFLSFGPITSGTVNEYLPVASNAVFGALEDVVFEEIVIPITELANQGNFSVLVQDNLSEWTPWTPTFGSNAVGLEDFRWRQVGDSIEIHGFGEWNGAGGTFSFTMPQGLTIDGSNYDLGSSSPLGCATVVQSPFVIPAMTTYINSTTLGMISAYNVTSFSVSGLNYLAQPNLNNGDQFELSALVRVVEYAGQQPSLVGSTEASSTNIGLAGPSGTWTPTGTAVTAVSSITPEEFMYTRVGKIVTFSGSVDATASGSSDIEFSLTLPPLATSDFTLDTDCSGAGCSNVGGLAAVSVRADTATNEIFVFGQGNGGGSRNFRITGQYQIK